MCVSVKEARPGFVGETLRMEAGLGGRVGEEPERQAR